MALEEGGGSTPSSTLGHKATKQTRKRRRIASESDDDDNDDDFESPVARRSAAPRGTRQPCAGDAVSAVLITGPVGSGKTAAVYALSDELGFSVREVHTGDKRSGQAVLALVKEATQSHRAFGGPSAATDGKPTLLLFEDVDVVFPELDKGFAAALRELVLSTKRPLVFTATSGGLGAMPHWEPLRGITGVPAELEMGNCEAAEAWGGVAESSAVVGRERVHVVPFASPTNDEVHAVVARAADTAAAHSSVAPLSPKRARRIAEAARGDMRRALLQAQYAAYGSGDAAPDDTSAKDDVSDDEAADEDVDGSALRRHALVMEAKSAATHPSVPALPAPHGSADVLALALEATVTQAGRHCSRLVCATVGERVDRAGFLARIARTEAGIAPPTDAAAAAAAAEAEADAKAAAAMAATDVVGSDANNGEAAAQKAVVIETFLGQFTGRAVPRSTRRRSSATFPYLELRVGLDASVCEALRDAPFL